MLCGRVRRDLKTEKKTWKITSEARLFVKEIKEMLSGRIGTRKRKIGQLLIG